MKTSFSPSVSLYCGVACCCIHDVLFLFFERYSQEMAQKSDIIGLPVVPFNQNKVADVCQYLQWLQDFFFKVFKTEVRCLKLLHELT